LRKQIYTYALIKSFYDKGEEYLDAFWPFTIKVFLSDTEFLSLNAIQVRIDKEFLLQIPLHALKTILNRARRKDYVSQKKGGYGLAEKGLKYRNTLETDKSVERRLNSLFVDIKQFLNERGIIKNISQIQNDFLSFILKNVGLLTEFFHSSIVSSQPIIPKATILERQLIEYIEIVDKQEPEHYTTLQDIILGSIISTILSSEDPSEITEIRKRKFKHCQIFLDTCFVFSMLGLSRQEFIDPAKELFDLLKEYGFEVKIFSFTVDEICRVINGYTKDWYRYPIDIRIGDTLYSTLKIKGWGKSDAKEFIMNIDNILSNSGIKIEWIKDIDLDNYEPKDSGLRNKIKRYKPDQGLFFQNHDLAALERMKELREQPIRKMEDSKFFFLTSDKRLNKFNFFEMSHRENGTICEAILDCLLTTILWLKNPKAKVSLKSLIGIYSRDFFVKRRIWDRFYETLQELKKEENVKDEAISMLFYDNYIEDVLIGFDDSEKNKITQEFVLEEIEKASKLPEKKVERIIKEKEKEFLECMEEKISKKEQEKDEEWLRKIQKLKKNIRNSAEKSSSYRSFVYSSFLTVLILILMVGIYLGLNKLGLSGILPWLIPSLFGIGGISKIWVKLRSYFKSKLTKSIYSKKLREVGLHKKEEEM